jgi:predicted dehydrogenase
MADKHNEDLLKVGVIGAGWPGERHAEGYLASGVATVVAVSDLEQARREAFAAHYDVAKSYAAYQELLEDPDIEAVSVALPNFLHFPATMAALEAGKHVLCEKPPALTAAETRSMQELAEQRGLLLAYALQRRMNPSTQDLLGRIEAAELGEVYHARAVWTRAWGVPQGVGDWFTDPARSGGGALIDIGVHVLDLAWFLMGCPAPTTVSGQIYNKYPSFTRTEDSAFALIRFADGRSLDVEASWILAQESDQMGVHIYGTGGGAQLDDRTLNLYTVGGDGLVRTTPSLQHYPPPFVAQATNFVRAVKGLESLRTPAAQGTLLMEMLEALYRSAAEGREVVL